MEDSVDVGIVIYILYDYLCSNFQGFCFLNHSHFSGYLENIHTANNEVTFLSVGNLHIPMNSGINNITIYYLTLLSKHCIFNECIVLAKQGDNGFADFGSIHLSIPPSICPSEKMTIASARKLSALSQIYPH